MQASMHDTEMSEAMLKRYNESGYGDYFETLDVLSDHGDKMTVYMGNAATVEKLQNALATSAYAPQAVQLAAWDEALRRFKEDRGWA